MHRLALNALGSYNVSVDDVLIPRFPTAKTTALLFYLALESQQSGHATAPRLVARPLLAGLLWPDVGETYARRSLRNTLYHLRQTLEKIAPGLGERLFQVTRGQIGVDRTNIIIDAVVFQGLIAAAADHPHDSLSRCHACLERLSQSLTLYHGEFLAGFDLEDAPAFEEWLLLQREMFHLYAMTAARELAAAYETRQEWDKAQRVALQLLHLDPYSEDSHCQLIRVYASHGMANRALNQYHTLRRMLQAQFGEEPGPETELLVSKIVSGEFSRQVASPTATSIQELARMESGETTPVRPSAQPSIDTTVHATSGPHMLDVPHHEGAFLGRHAELDQLQQWLMHDGCRLVMILGIGGQGKTTLAAKIARTHAGQIDSVYWRSLLNAPPLDMVLHDYLNVLSNHEIVPPDGIAAKVAETHRHLEQKRHLLVLDNLETILDADRAGHFRSGYEAYEQVLSLFADGRHQSTLLVTSREAPLLVTRLERASDRVVTMKLAGLTESDSASLLAAEEIIAASDLVKTLTQRYSGNPLALQLAAQTIEEFYFGDIRAFLGDESFIFEDIRDVLDQQFGRLSPLEQEIMLWLAITREATDLLALANMLIRPTSRKQLLDASIRLQRRSLLVREQHGFTLQNVVMEYLTDRLVAGAVDELTEGALDLLHRHPLMLTQAKEYVRQSQLSLILQPVAAQLLVRIGSNRIVAHMQKILNDLRQEAGLRPSYAGGSILNLLLHLGKPVNGFDFSQLAMWQSDLQGAFLHDVNFTRADLSQTLFFGTFGSIRTIAVGSHSGIKLEGRHSHGGEILAAGTGSAEIYLWGLDSGQPEGVLEGHSLHMIYVAIGPRTAPRPLLASASGDGTVGIWDLASKSLIRFLGANVRLATEQNDEQVRPVRVVAISPDGAVVASGSEDHKIRMWRIETGELLTTIERHEDWVNALCFHPNGHILASGGTDGVIHLWDMHALLLQTAGARGIQIRDSSADSSIIRTLQKNQDKIFTLAFSPDGSKLASGGGDGTVRLWDVAGGQMLHELKGHRGVVWSVDFSPNGSILASGSADHTVRLWDVSTGRPLDTLQGHAHAVRAVAFNEDGDTLVSGGLDDAIRLWDMRSSSRWQAYKLWRGYTEHIMAVAFSHDGTRLAAGTQKGTGYTWDLRDSAATRPRPVNLHQAEIRAVVACPNRPLYASTGFDGTICIWDGSSNREHVVLTLQDERRINCLSYAHNGALLASAGDIGLIKLWNVSTPGNYMLHSTLHGHEQAIQALAFSPDDRRMASASRGGTIRLWDVSQGSSVNFIKMATTDCLSLDFHPDGYLLAGGGKDGCIYLWTLPDQGREPWVLTRELVDHQSGIHQVAFSPDGHFLASASSDGSVRIWDASTGELLHILDEHMQDVWTISFRPDSNILASGSFDGKVKLWNVQTGACVRTLQPPRPYENMTITGVTGISEVQRAALKALGAVETG